LYELVALLVRFITWLLSLLPTSKP